MSTPQQIQVPPQMLQQLLRGPTPAQKPPDVVEVMTQTGERLCFNMDAVEKIHEESDGCLIKLKDDSEWIAIKMKYDEFLYATKIQPRQLHVKADPGG